MLGEEKLGLFSSTVTTSQTKMGQWWTGPHFDVQTAQMGGATQSDVYNPDPVFEFQVSEDGFGELALDYFVSFGGDIKSVSFLFFFSWLLMWLF